MIWEHGEEVEQGQNGYDDLDPVKQPYERGDSRRRPGWICGTLGGMLEDEG